MVQIHSPRPLPPMCQVAQLTAQKDANDVLIVSQEVGGSKALAQNTSISFRNLELSCRTLRLRFHIL
jgi:hypothetical protein